MTSDPATTPLLQLRGIVKTFPGVRALDGVELEVLAGEVHCLLGQNGAGKSTLIKVLAGVHRPDAGSLLWHGEETVSAGRRPRRRRASPRSTRSSTSSTTSRWPRTSSWATSSPPAGSCAAGRMRSEATAVLERLGHGGIPVNRKVGRLPAAKQIVSMGRALSHEAQLLVMDEPSAVLAHDEVANLFRVIRDLTVTAASPSSTSPPARGDPRDRGSGHGAEGRADVGGQSAGTYDEDGRPRHPHDGTKHRVRLPRANPGRRAARRKPGPGAS